MNCQSSYKKIFIHPLEKTQIKPNDSQINGLTLTYFISFIIVSDFL